MSEMIERVARAIRNISPEAWSQIPTGVQRLHCEDARRAIEAMREPTPEIITAIRNVIEGRNGVSQAVVPTIDDPEVVVNDEGVVAIFGAAIDAALSQSGE